MVNIPIGGNSALSSNLNSTGNAFTILVQPAVKIPPDAKNCKVFLRNLRCPYSFVNINASNNKFYFTDNIAIPNKYTFTFANGLYSLSQLNSILQINLQNAINTSGFAFTNTVFQYVADSSSDTLFLVISSSGYQVNHSAGSFQNLTGFTLGRNTPSGALTTAASTYFVGNTSVGFQNVTDVVVGVSLPIDYYYNNQSRAILGLVNIDVGPNQQIIYPGGLIPEYMKLDCNLAGSLVSSISVSLLDQTLQPLDLNGKYFSFELNIEYDI